MPVNAAVRRKRQYRCDPECRASILASNQRSRAKHASPERTRLNRLASEIWRVRKSVDFHMQAAADADRRLLALVKEREALKQKTGNIKPVFGVYCGR